MGILDALFGKKKEDELKCPRCKVVIPKGAKVCPQCGRNVDELFRVTCPQCKEVIPFTAKVCPNCGKSFVHEEISFRCPNCGYVANYRMFQCPVCGTRFG